MHNIPSPRLTEPSLFCGVSAAVFHSLIYSCLLLPLFKSFLSPWRWAFGAAGVWKVVLVGSGAGWGEVVLVLVVGGGGAGGGGGGAGGAWRWGW